MPEDHPEALVGYWPRSPHRSGRSLFASCARSPVAPP